MIYRWRVIMSSILNFLHLFYLFIIPLMPLLLSLLFSLSILVYFQQIVDQFELYIFTHQFLHALNYSELQQFIQLYSSSHAGLTCQWSRRWYKCKLNNECQLAWYLTMLARNSACVYIFPLGSWWWYKYKLKNKYKLGSCCLTMSARKSVNRYFHFERQAPSN